MRKIEDIKHILKDHSHLIANYQMTKISDYSNYSSI